MGDGLCIRLKIVQPILQKQEIFLSIFSKKKQDCFITPALLMRQRLRARTAAVRNFRPESRRSAGDICEDPRGSAAASCVRAARRDSTTTSITAQPHGDRADPVVTGTRSWVCWRPPNDGNGSNSYEIIFREYFLPHFKSNTNTNLDIFGYECKTGVSNSDSNSDIDLIYKLTFSYFLY